MNIKCKSVKTKYIISGLIICLFCLIPISFFSYLVSRHITVELSDKMIREKAVRTSNEIDYWFKSRQNIMASLAQQIELFGDFSDDKLNQMLQNEMNMYKEDTVDFYIGFADKSRKMVSASNWNVPDDYDPAQRTWYQLAAQTDTVIFTDPYVDAMTGKLVITVAKSLKSNGVIIGVLANDIYLSEVIRVVESSKINENSYGMLLDDSGKIIVHPDSDFLPTTKGTKELREINWKGYPLLVNELLTKGTTKSIPVQGYTNEKEIFNFCKISSNDWFMGISVKQSEYDKPLQNLLLGFAASLFLSMILAFLIMYKLINSMIKPIKSLNDVVRTFSSDTSIRTDISSMDEIGELGRNFNEMADTIQEYGQSLERKVLERTEELQKKNETIIESIEYARKIQNAIIPDISKRLQIAEEDCFSVWRPRDIVGGDVFWCNGNTDYSLLILADCTGHGVPGALMSMALTSILDTAVKELQYQDPAKIMYTIHERLLETLGQNDEDCEISDGADIAIVYVDKREKKIIFCGAKLHLFIVSQGNIQFIKGSRDSVGYTLNKEVHYSNVEIPYTEDMICYLSTDGFLDQNKEKNTGGIGRRGFISFMNQIHHLPIPEQRKIIEEDIDGKLHDVPQRDDITIIGLKLGMSFISH